jgi:hypothetical protein
MIVVGRQEPEPRRKESCGNDGAMESVESQKQASPFSHSPLEISPRTGEISTFPQLRREAGGWKNGKPKAGFPLSHRHESIDPGMKTRAAGRAPPPARRRALRAVLRVKK